MRVAKDKLKDLVEWCWKGHTVDVGNNYQDYFWGFLIIKNSIGALIITNTTVDGINPVLPVVRSIP